MTPMRIVEEGGKIYAYRYFIIRGRVEELYQRLEKKDSIPRRLWHGTKLAADNQFGRIQKFREECRRFRARTTT